MIKTKGTPAIPAKVLAAETENDSVLIMSAEQEDTRFSFSKMIKNVMLIFKGETI